MDYLEYLIQKGIPIAKPVRSSIGALIESLSTTEDPLRCAVFEALPGDHPDFDELTRDQFRQWGELLGRLHKATEGFTVRGRSTWQDHLAMIEAHLPAHETAAHVALIRVKDQLSALPITPHNFGLIHFDFELDNLLWHEGSISIIDFDDAAFYWFAADIAFALRDLFHDDPAQVDFSHESLLAFLEGYRAEKELSDEEVQQIPVFLRLHNLLLFTRLIRSLGPEVPADEPEWMTKLRARLAQKMDRYRDSFRG